MIPDKTSSSGSEILRVICPPREMASLANDVIDQWCQCNQDKNIVSTSITTPFALMPNPCWGEALCLLTINWIRKA